MCHSSSNTFSANNATSKEEALKEKEALENKQIAETCFRQKKFKGAKYFAEKARTLYPWLEGINQLIEALEVLISAETKTKEEEVDWYKIFGVKPWDNPSTIQKKFKKLALAIHPDRNKSVAALSAFKTVSEAWSVLSNEEARDHYDEKRRRNLVFENIVLGSPAVPRTGQSSSNIFFNGSGSNQQAYGSASSSSSSQPSPAFSFNAAPTFWTFCTVCSTQFKYARVYLNKYLRCQQCRGHFFAVEMPMPSSSPANGNASLNPLNQQNPSQSNPFGQYAPGWGSASAANMGRAMFSGAGSSRNNLQGGFFAGVGAAMRPPTFVPSQPSVETMRAGPNGVPNRWQWKRKYRTEEPRSNAPGSASAGLGANVTKGERPRKRRKQENEQKKVSPEGTGIVAVAKDSLSGPQSDVTSRRKLSAAGTSEVNFSKELVEMERSMLISMANRTICEKIDESRAIEASKVLLELREVTDHRRRQMAVAKPVAKVTARSRRQYVVSKGKNGCKKSSFTKSDIILTLSEDDPVLMSVPDPDFYDFDRDRVESSFESNQVWAAYDQEDGMPRFYVLVHRVLSRDPFRVRISWLSHTRDNEVSPDMWVASGFTRTNGHFELGTEDTNESLNSFSHKVNWTINPRGYIGIFPSKGEVWALYRNWSPNWNVYTPNEVVREYDMVEVLENYSDMQGQRVLPLVKVAGFKTVFSRNHDPRTIISIPKREMTRFSHQVPARFLTGNEGRNAPAGYWEIDPAASPLELIAYTEPTNNGPEKAKGLEEAPVENNRPMPTEQAKKRDEDVAESSNSMNNGTKLKVYARRQY